MKKSQLRKIIREHLNEFFDTPYGKWDGRFTPGWEQPDQWYDNIATDGGLTTQNRREPTINEGPLSVAKECKKCLEDLCECLIQGTAKEPTCTCINCPPPPPEDERVGGGKPIRSIDYDISKR